MKENEDVIVKAKKVECWIGIVFLIPPILGVLFFILNLFGVDWDVVGLENLSEEWTTVYGYDKGGGGGMSAAPIYLGMMAMVGAYLVKDSLKYLFIRHE